MSLILDGTNGLSDVDGSAATPAIRGSDANTGVFFGADQVGIATNGVERVEFGNSETVFNDGGANVDFRVEGDTDANLLFVDASADALLVGTASLGGSPAKFLVQRDSISGAQTTVNIYNSAATSTSKTAGSLLRIASQGSGADTGIQCTDSVANNYYFGGNNGGAYVMTNTNGVRLSNGGTSWASDSDERVKDIIEPITNAAEKVSTLRAVIGKYKTDEEGIRRAFLIAQDVQAVLPEAVVAQSDEIGTLSLAYTDTIPLLVAAIKEQQAIITALTARVEALEGAQA
jgi:hypothetical protein